MKEAYSKGKLEEVLLNENYKPCIIWGIIDFFKEKGEVNDSMGN